MDLRKEVYCIFYSHCFHRPRNSKYSDNGYKIMTLYFIKRFETYQYSKLMQNELVHTISSLGRQCRHH